MAFTGKATYSAGTTLPEIAEDVADVVGIISPFETPLLDALGDPLRAAMSTHHEWIEDSLLANTDTIDDDSFIDPDADTDFDVAHGDRFQVGDQIQAAGSRELMLVAAVAGNTLTVVRGYADTTPEDLDDGLTINILGNAALEGADKPDARFTNRMRRANYTQIFTSAVEVSGSDLAARQLGLRNELDHQKGLRLRELLRDLENTVINGGQATTNPQGSATVRRTLKGVIGHLTSNVFTVGDAELPAGNDLDEAKISYVLRQIWNRSNSVADLIVVNGFQKRRINGLMTAVRGYGPKDRVYSDLVSEYDGDFGRCRIVVTRWMPQDMVLFLDSRRIDVLPLAGRSFHFKPLASSGDYECGQLIGEYTLEMRNEEAHGCLRGLSTN
ncbi:MAG: DUF5309 family protein [Sedimentisphaerales bacterium]|nr:DUF5309 family protein [Sedimentisphaerales bacterium]